MGNAPRTGNPYDVGGGGAAPQAQPSGSNDAYAAARNPAPFDVPYDRGGMATMMAARPPSIKAPEAMTTAPAVRAQQKMASPAGLQAQQSATIAAAPMLAPAPAVTPAPAAAPKATTPAPAAAPKATTPAPAAAPAAAPKATTPAPAVVTPAATTPAATPAAPAGPVATPVYTPPKATAATPKAATVAPASSIQRTDAWTPEQIQVGGRWEAPPAGSTAVSQQWAPYTAPTAQPTAVTPATDALRTELATAIATQSGGTPATAASTNGIYYPTTGHIVPAQTVNGVFQPAHVVTQRGGAWMNGGRGGEHA